MYTRNEGFFTSQDDHRLYYQVWKPNSPKGALVITHGHGEHSDSYHRLVEALAPLSLTIYGWDLRGHGRSDGQRGYAKDFNYFVSDLHNFYQFLTDQQAFQKQPVFMLGHSMGGLIQTLAMIENPQWNVQAQILSSPMYGIALDVPIVKDMAALLMAKVFPKVTMGNEIQNQDLTQDQQIHTEYDKDVLRHNRMSPGVYLGSLMAFEKVRTKSNLIQVPTLVQIPEVDPVVSSDVTRDIFKKLGASEKVLKQYPNCRHELYNDIYRSQVYSDLSEFIGSK